MEKKKNVNCPIDANHCIKKNGHKNGTQLYWCYNRCKSFFITNGSVVRHSKLTYHQFKTLLQCMYDYKPPNETALEGGISETSVFDVEILIPPKKSDTIIYVDILLINVNNFEEVGGI